MQVPLIRTMEENHDYNLCSKKDNQVAMAGDGQVTMGEKVIMKGTARKNPSYFDNQVLVGFAGGVADAITLEENV